MAELTGTTADVLLLKQGPALRATSDHPNAEPLPDPAVVPAPPTAEPAETDAPALPEDGIDLDAIREQQAEAVPPATEARPDAGRKIGERLSKMAHDRDLEKARADEAIKATTRLAEELAATRAELNKRPAAEEPPPAPPPPAPAPARPKREDFIDPDAYEAAWDGWAAGIADRAAKNAAEGAMRAAEEKAERQRVEAEQGRLAAENQQQVTRTIDNFAEKAREFAKDHPDFDLQELSERPGVDFPVTQDVMAGLMSTDNGPAILYHFTQHVDELKRIAQLPPGRIFIELGKIEASLAAAPRPEVSRAPRPLPRTALGNGAATAAAERDPNEMTTEEWAARRTPELQAERRASTLGQPPRRAN